MHFSLGKGVFIQFLLQLDCWLMWSSFSLSFLTPSFSICCFLVISPCFPSTFEKSQRNYEYGYQMERGDEWAWGKPFPGEHPNCEETAMWKDAMSTNAPTAQGQTRQIQRPALWVILGYECYGRWANSMASVTHAMSRGGAAFTSVSLSAVKNVYPHAMPICSSQTVVWLIIPCYIWAYLDWNLNVMHYFPPFSFF